MKVQLRTRHLTFNNLLKFLFKQLFRFERNKRSIATLLFATVKQRTPVVMPREGYIDFYFVAHGVRTTRLVNTSSNTGTMSSF